MRRRTKLHIVTQQFRCDGLYREASRLARLGRDGDALKCYERAEKVRYGRHGIGHWFCFFRGPKGDRFDPFCNWTISP